MVVADGDAEPSVVCPDNVEEEVGAARDVEVRSLACVGSQVVALLLALRSRSRGDVAEEKSCKGREKEIMIKLIIEL